MLDTSKSTLIIAALVAAFLVGLLTANTADATHQNLYQTTMAPPTHADGAQAVKTCGWHVGSCYDNNNGSALDWGYWNGSQADYNVRFRGWLYRSGTSYSNGYLILNVFQYTSGATVCNEMVADVIEIQPWRVRYGMHYTHTNNSVGGGYGVYVSGSGIGAWNSPIVGYMVNDGGCPWGGYHTHAVAVPVALSYYYENRATYACCNSGYTYHQNNVEANRTHVTQFWQGH